MNGKLAVAALGILIVSVAVPTLLWVGPQGDADSCTRDNRVGYKTVEDLPDNPDPDDFYGYENLSSDAQRIVQRTVADGAYNFSDGSQDPPEFDYGDQASNYVIEYRNDTYVLTTWGCPAR